MDARFPIRILVGTRIVFENNQNKCTRMLCFHIRKLGK